MHFVIIPRLLYSEVPLNESQGIYFLVYLSWFSIHRIVSRILKLLSDFLPIISVCNVNQRAALEQ